MCPRRGRGWSVWVEPNGDTWRCRWRGRYGTGEQPFFFRRDAGDAREERIRDYQRRDAGLPALPRAVREISLGDAAAEYLAYSAHEKGVRTYRNFDKPAVEALVAHFGKARLLSAIEPGDVQRWKHALPQANGKQRTTASMTFRSVGTFFNYMVRMKRLAVSPAKGLSKPEEGDGGRPLEDSEITGLMAHAEEALYRTGHFSMNTMLRIGEVCAFDWSWVSELRVSGPDGVPVLVWVGRIPWQVRKTRKKVRRDSVFPINAKARAVMGPRQAMGRVFPWSVTTIQHQVLRARAKSGLPDDVTFHCFRHSGASRYLDKFGHMEDLLENGTGTWRDARSLLRYVRVRMETLVARFDGIEYPVPSPIPPLKTRTAGP